jgi:hypothetical protein
MAISNEDASVTEAKLVTGICIFFKKFFSLNRCPLTCNKLTPCGKDVYAVTFCNVSSATFSNS